jgi:hypothetical protein
MNRMQFKTTANAGVEVRKVKAHSPLKIVELKQSLQQRCWSSRAHQKNVCIEDPFRC